MSHNTPEYLEHPIKCALTGADRECMIISDEQARMVASDLANVADSTFRRADCTVDPAVIQRACSAALRAPDAREDRIIQARARLLAGLPDSHEIASKMVSRIMSDALR